VPIPRWQALLLSIASIVLVFAVWWLLTFGERGEDRIVSPSRLPSLQETFGSFESLWFERALTRNTYASLKRVVLGFGLAAIVGVPVGILCGCFTRISAFLAPLTIFGRNIPMAALIPLSFSLFGIGEWQKIMFIFIAAVAFIVSDSAQAVRDVATRYVDTAYTLGARRWQVILKVLVPLAMPSIFNSLRLLFGLAFGYIMLAEVIQVGGISGLGGIINNSFRRGPKEHIYLVLIIIPLVALAIDRLLFWIQKQLFPYRYGGPGLLATACRRLLHAGEWLKSLFFTPVDISMIAGGSITGGETAAVSPVGSSSSPAGEASASPKDSP
jgi:NitT/TauT family transport system permease protein